MVKASVRNITFKLGFIVVPKALAMARLSVVPSPLVIPPPSTSRFHPLAQYCPISLHLTAKTLPQAGTLLLSTRWHPTATHLLAPYCYSPAGTLLHLLRSVDLFSVTPSRGIALPLWLLSNALDRCNDVHARASGFSGPTVSVFSPFNNHLSTPLRPAFVVFQQAVSFVFGSLLKGLGLSTCTFLCILSLCVWGLLS